MSNLISKPNVLFFGDSVFQYSNKYAYGTVNYFRNRYNGMFAVEDYSHAGDNTRQGLSVVRKVIRTGWRTAHVAVFLYGANDAALDGRHVDVEEYMYNLEWMVNIALREAREVIIVTMFPLPLLDEIKDGKVIRTAGTYDAYCRPSLLLRERHQVRICDVYGAVRAKSQHRPDWQEYLYDCVHPNGQGYRLLNKTLEPILDDALDFWGLQSLPKYPKRSPVQP